MPPVCTHRDLFAECGEVAVVEIAWKQWGTERYCAVHEALYTTLKGRCGGTKTPLNAT